MEQMISVADAAAILAVTTSRVRQMVAEGVLTEQGRVGGAIALRRREVEHLARGGWPGRRPGVRVSNQVNSGLSPRKLFTASRPLRGGGVLRTHAATEEGAEQMLLSLLSQIENVGAEDRLPSHVLAIVADSDTAEVAEIEAGFTSRQDVQSVMIVAWIHMREAIRAEVAVRNERGEIVETFPLEFDGPTRG